MHDLMWCRSHFTMPCSTTSTQQWSPPLSISSPLQRNGVERTYASKFVFRLEGVALARNLTRWDGLDTQHPLASTWWSQHALSTNHCIWERKSKIHICSCFFFSIIQKSSACHDNPSLNSKNEVTPQQNNITRMTTKII